MLRFSHSDYWIEHSPKIIKEGAWSGSQITIWRGDQKIGEYTYNYPSPNNTFWPFLQNDHWYALCSEDYTATSVMSLPDCKIVAKEKGHAFGFCPVDFYVPSESKGKYGFVAGCVWGDDSSWKIQYLDLSKITEGIISRDDRFGYISMPRNVESLKDCINVDLACDPDPSFDEVYITSERAFWLNDHVENMYRYINGEMDEATIKLHEERIKKLREKK